MATTRAKPTSVRLGVEADRLWRQLSETLGIRNRTKTLELAITRLARDEGLIPRAPRIRAGRRAT